MATLKQIADLAGVSRGTVDRVLYNRGIVKPETAAKILNIAEMLQYTPNKVAKTLAAKKKKIKLGYIMFGGARNPFFEDVVSGITQKSKDLEEFGASVDIRYSDFGNVAQQIRLMDEMAADGIQGIAITPINHPDIAAKIKCLAKAGIPTVTANTDIPNSDRIAYVGSDYNQSGKIAAGLIRLITGEKANIGIVVGSMEILCHSQRVIGFQAALAPYPQISIVETVENHDDDIESFSQTKELLMRHPEIDALFLASAGVYGACRAVAEIAKNNKIKIISFDCVPTTKKLLQEGMISATICQQPQKQGAVPLDILFNFLGMGIKPITENHYTGLEIKIKESL